MKRTILFFLCASCSLLMMAQATIKETTESILTYGYSDPTPVAQLAPQSNRPSYPYNRWDNYDLTGKPRDWKVVTLENQYISVTVLPEVGGKVWGAIEKSTGREFLYQNHVMKFRDIAMRGAWTSGGLEFNFGILGHVPTTATPVDYTTVTKSNGSVSCYVASYEWVTGAWWMVEINLPKDGAYFTTSVTWQNQSSLPQSSYQWMNAAYTIRGNAEFIYPGTHGIGHEGDWDTYPVTKAGREINWYKNTTFGGSTSVHVIGNYNDFYGIYWHDWNFGSAHVAHYGDKLGQKYFIWSQSRSGGIWEDLLTDNDGQYIEMQSGRMYCQPTWSTMFTPFKHTALEPSETNTWTELWAPIKDINGLKKTSGYGALNVVREDGNIHIKFCPLRKFRAEMRVYDADREVGMYIVDAKVLQKWEQTIPATGNLAKEGTLRVVIGNQDLVYSEQAVDNETNRPLDMPADFNWETAYGHYLKGENWANQKRFPEAVDELTQSLSIDPYFLPALSKLAAVYNAQGRYAEAKDLCMKGLSVSTYDGACNYQYALASEALGEITHAKDGYEMAAARDLSLRSAAYFHLAQMAMRENNYTQALEWAERSMQTNSRNLLAQHLIAARMRVIGSIDHAEQRTRSLLAAAPLYQPARYELFLLGKMTAEEFCNGIRQELQSDVYLELSDEYVAMGQYQEALQLLSFCPTSPICAYHKAYIQHLQGNEAEALGTLQSAVSNTKMEFVFPHRLTTMAVLQWAESVQPAWQNRYYLGLVYLGTQQKQKAVDMWMQCEESSFAPLFLTRATYQQDDAQLQSLLRSEKLSEAWRCGYMLTNYYINHNDSKNAVAVAKRYDKRYPGNYYIDLVYAKALCQDSQYSKCIQVLESAHVIPYEDETGGHDIYRDAYLGIARQQLDKGKYQAALDAVAKARLWPENIGVGKPYDEDIDSSREDAMEAEIRSKMKYVEHK